MQPRYTLNGVVHEVTPLKRSDSITLQIDGHQLDARLHWHDRHRGEITLNGAPHIFYAAQDGNSLFIHFDGKVWQLESHDEFSGTAGGGESDGSIAAPMPGVVVELYVNVGDVVADGATVMMIESMKLQTEIKATVAGVVKVLDLEPGASFEKGSVLIEIEAADASDFGAERSE